jgi:hypothetical protein
VLYADQNPVVFSKIDDLANGIIRLKFADVTLSLSLLNAGWLAANIQREIRKIEQENPEICLKIGDIVTVRDDAGHEANYEVKQAPWMLPSGKAVIGLKGISGCYSLDRVTKVVSTRRTC